MPLKQLTSASGERVYHVTAGKSVPEWLSDKKKRALRKDDEVRRHLELVQGLEFDAACTSLRLTNDGEFLLAAGYHPPTLKCFELKELSTKWMRCVNAEIVEMLPLEDDYAKIALICSDRTVAFHAKFGAYYETRIPRVGRSLVYLTETAELLIGASAPEIYRINLSEGRFMAPLTTGLDAANSLDVSGVHGLLAVGGEGGGVECYDPRERSCIGRLEVGDDVTVVKFDTNGLQMGVGTSGGIVKVYDLRSRRPLIEKDHMYDAKIVSLNFHSPAAGALEDSARSVISSDKHAIRIWDARSGSTSVAIEPPRGGIHDVCCWKGSGLMMAACEQSRVQSFFVPSMGPAPRWCHFLEGLTEELEEGQNAAVYDDYKFITREELSSLGLDHLLGTKLLRPSMHGFFIDLRLYKKAKSIAEPFAYETYKKKKVQDALAATEKSRIAIRKKLPKVNAAIADKLREQADAPEANGGVEEEGMTHAERKRMKRENIKRTEAASLLNDDRFKAMFEDERFQVDETAMEYKTLHPNAGKEDDLLKEHFDEQEDDDESEEEDGEEEEDVGDKEDAQWGEDANAAFGLGGSTKKRSIQRPRMLMEKDDMHASAFSKGVSLADKLGKPFAERVVEEAEKVGSKPAVIETTNKEITFEVDGKKGKKNRSGAQGSQLRADRERRAMEGTEGIPKPKKKATGGYRKSSSGKRRR